MSDVPRDMKISKPMPQSELSFLDVPNLVAEAMMTADIGSLFGLRPKHKEPYIQMRDRFLLFLYLVDTMTKKRFSAEEAKKIGDVLHIDWNRFDVEQFRKGLDVELEHGQRDLDTNVTNDDPIMTGKIALAHLNEFPDYYTRLDKMEAEAEKFHKKQKVSK